ncbi:hypothetical protein F2Q69_00014651 [Brassica cretica]|nr:hypothetical protein F2Q69_00014651 [Brassica cretica]
MDPNLKGDYGSDSAWKVLELAMSCSRLSSAERPNMAQVVHELNECLMYEKSRRGNSQDRLTRKSVLFCTISADNPMHGGRHLTIIRKSSLLNPRPINVPCKRDRTLPEQLPTSSTSKS